MTWTPSLTLRTRTLVLAGLWLLVPSSWCRNSSAQGFAPRQAVERMRVAEGFSVELVACEPLVRQPVCIEFDDRGRLWVIQYLQYPNPEGLKRVHVDRYSRTEYERVPEPPPRGPRGADRITILNDTDGDGQMDQASDFVAGLNLASGIAFGHGGVFVLNVPYLLFYPDRDRDDVPDSDPEVLLSGFGMQDAHSVANSLTWGPDGWLYGCQGSTVTANIRSIEFQQGVWRYHPTTRQFELFCEGGGNAWGLDFDAAGNLFYSTNYGGHVCVHGVQDAYYVKSFAKHGALHNPYAYGYFPHAPHENFQGGHVTVGGVVYQGDSFPQAFHGRYIAGDLLGHGVYTHAIDPRGSTFRTSHQSVLLEAKDSWFAPTDLTVGPEGSIYVADWYDARTAHPDPDADWDRTNGRIYRIVAGKTDPSERFDLTKFTTSELIDLHEHPNQWWVRRARQELVRRNDPETRVQLRDGSLAHRGKMPPRETLWTLYSMGEIDETMATSLLEHADPVIRYWVLRSLGDAATHSDALSEQLVTFSQQESDAWVRQQLACTAARLSARQSIPLIRAAVIDDRDHDDPLLPLLWWWAVERHCDLPPSETHQGPPLEAQERVDADSGREQLLECFVDPRVWSSRLGREFLLPRLVRRFSAEATRSGTDAVVRLLEAAPDETSRDAFWQPVLLGLSERTSKPSSPAVDRALSQRVLARWQQRPDNLTLLRTAIRLGLREPRQAALDQALDAATPHARQIELLATLSVAADSLPSDPFVALVRTETDDAVRIAALEILAQINDQSIGSTLIKVHQSTYSEPVRREIRDVLLGRRQLARQWLEAVDSGAVAASATPIEQIRRVALFSDDSLDALVLKHWGKLDGATREESLAEVRRLNNDLRAAPGDRVRGREVFRKHCSTCHQLFGEGEKVGPDLTTANRSDRTALLVSLVAPSSVIRKEYVSLVVQTVDGRVVTGLPLKPNPGEQNDQSLQASTNLILVDRQGKPHAVPAGDVERVKESDVSLMPDDLYRSLSPRQLRDLFAYLQSQSPPPEP